MVRSHSIAMSQFDLESIQMYPVSELVQKWQWLKLFDFAIQKMWCRKSGDWICHASHR